MATRNKPLRPVTQEDLDTIRSKRMTDLELSKEVLDACASEQVETVGDLYDLSAGSLVATNFTCEQVKQLRKLMAGLGLRRPSPRALTPKQQVELQKLVRREHRELIKIIDPDNRRYSEENGRYLGHLLSRDPVVRAFARHMLVIVNEPGVRGIAYRYAGQLYGSGRTQDCSIDLEDLIAEGNMGVMRAAEEFDPRTGFEFYTYAIWWIRHHIRRYLQDGGIIRIPVGLQLQVRKFNRVLKTLPPDISKEGLCATMCKEIQIPPEKFDDFLVKRSELELLYPERLDSRSSGNDEVRDMYEQAQIANAFDMDSFALDSWLVRDLGRTLEEISERMGMPERTRTMMLLLYGFGRDEPMTLKAVGDLYGLSRERVRQIEELALEHMARSSYWDGKEDQLAAMLGRSPFQ